MTLDQRGEVTDPPQLDPLVLGPVDAEDDQEVLEAEASHALTRKVDLGRPRPQGVVIQLDGQRPGRDTPMGLDHDTVGRPEIEVLRLVAPIGPVLGRRERRCIGVLLVSARPQQRDEGLDMLVAHQDVEVSGLPERGVSIGLAGQQRTLEGQRQHAAQRQFTHDVPELFGEPPAALLVALDVDLQGVEQLCRRPVGAGLSAGLVDQRHHLVGECPADEAGPVDAVEWQAVTGGAAPKTGEQQPRLVGPGIDVGRAGQRSSSLK